MAAEEQYIASLSELVSESSRHIRDERERHILYGKAVVAALFEAYAEEDPFFENWSIAKRLFQILEACDCKEFNFRAINEILSHDARTRLSDISSVPKSDIGNSRTTVIQEYVAPKMLIENTYQAVGINLERTATSTEVLRALSYARRKTQFPPYMKTKFKGEQSLERTLRYMVTSEINQLDRHIRRYLVR